MNKSVIGWPSIQCGPGKKNMQNACSQGLVFITILKLVYNIYNRQADQGLIFSTTSLCEIVSPRIDYLKWEARKRSIASSERRPTEEASWRKPDRKQKKKKNRKPKMKRMIFFALICKTWRYFRTKVCNHSRAKSLIAEQSKFIPILSELREPISKWNLVCKTWLWPCFAGDLAQLCRALDLIFQTLEMSPFNFRWDKAKVIPQRDRKMDHTLRRKSEKRSILRSNRGIDLWDSVFFFFFSFFSDSQMGQEKIEHVSLFYFICPHPRWIFPPFSPDPPSKAVSKSLQPIPNTRGWCFEDSRSKKGLRFWRNTASKIAEI
jgi:hypothetical protein